MMIKRTYSLSQVDQRKDLVDSLSERVHKRQQSKDGPVGQPAQSTTLIILYKKKVNYH